MILTYDLPHCNHYTTYDSNLRYYRTVTITPPMILTYDLLHCNHYTTYDYNLRSTAL
jgi:hypothetical protein